jgi:hypothetical protein
MAGGGAQAAREILSKNAANFFSLYFDVFLAREARRELPQRGGGGGSKSCARMPRNYSPLYFVVFLAMEARRELPQRKVTTPTTTRYFTVSNMLSWSQKYRYSVNMAPRPAWKP